MFSIWRAAGALSYSLLYIAQQTAYPIYIPSEFQLLLPPDIDLWAEGVQGSYSTNHSKLFHGSEMKYFVGIVLDSCEGEDKTYLSG